MVRSRVQLRRRFLNKLLPELVRVINNLMSIIAVLIFTVETELIRRLTSWDLVDTEPLHSSLKFMQLR